VLVFNADDLGLDAAANDGIERALAAGLVREVSLVVTGPYAERGAAIARAAKGAGVGLHLNLTEGDALTGLVPGVTDRAGRFLGLPSLLFLASIGRVRDVRREVDAQLARLRELGFAPSHLNGHHHVHLFPGVREAVADAVREAGIRHVRLPVERTPRLSATRWLCARLAARFPRPVPTLPFVGHGLCGARDYRARALSLLELLPSPCEWMAHPRTGPRFAAELEALCDPAFFRARGVVPATYAEARPPQP
jgi:predicted glycoside hydrolase/deacetylase ChbG (UPF0249 family)